MDSQKKKILLIEDDKYISRAYKFGLEQAGFEVVILSNGSVRAEEIEKENANLILLDIILPNRNGFEVLGDIKMDDKLKKTPVIILSNLGQESDIKKGKELGADDYLIKVNYSMKEIVEKVKEILIKKEIDNK